MEPVRPLRDVFADLAGTDAGEARAALAAAGHDLSDDLLRTAIDGYAGTAPAEVAEHLAAADGADDGLALLASAPAGPWDGEVVLDPADDLAADDLAADDLAADDLDAADLLDVPAATVTGPADPADHVTDDAPADHAFGTGDADDPDEDLGPDDLDTLDDLDALDAPAAGHPVDGQGADADLGFDDGFGAGSPIDDLDDDGADDGPDAQTHDVHDAG
ncbi:hypothetical protein [Kineosporia sp. R_H_3]|uniref:hypothetical protein n=1 Tax=Kineosporia sp. R_H_3 TaxID=1961848 RepID=UPI000B4A650C|nr:hypothetical protein [Kineosporia sp. R_H_3]